MTNDQVDQGFWALHNGLSQAQLMYMDLRDAGDAANAAKAQSRMTALQGQVDSLLSKQLADWQAGAETLIPQLTALSNQAQQAVTSVSQDVSIAQNIVSALGVLDQLIAAGARFLS